MKPMTIIAHGSAEANPGPASIEVRVLDAEGASVVELAESIGNATPEYATYFAVVKGLQAAAEHFSDQTATLACTLQLSDAVVARQLNGAEPITNPGLVPFFIEVHNLRVTQFPQLTVTQKQSKQTSGAKK